MEVTLGKEVCEVINRCWHPVTVRLPDGIHHWEKCPKNKWARVEYNITPVSDGLFRKIPVGITNLPEPKKGVRYIVSEKVLLAVRELGYDRDDLLAPGHQKPDGNRQVKYCDGFRVG